MLCLSYTLYVSPSDFSDLPDPCLLAPCTSSPGPPDLQTNTAPGNIPVPVRPALHSCMVQPVSCSTSLTCPTQPQGHPHHVQNVLKSLTTMAADPYPFSQTMIQLSTQQEASVCVPTNVPCLGCSHAGCKMPAEYFTTASMLNQDASVFPEPLISPAMHLSESKVGDEVRDCCEGEMIFSDTDSALCYWQNALALA